MSGPTGYEPGGARQLLKTIAYVSDGFPSNEVPTPVQVFQDSRITTGITGFITDPNAPLQYNVTNPVDGSPATVFISAWGGPPLVISNPPVLSSSE